MDADNTDDSGFAKNRDMTGISASLRALQSKECVLEGQGSQEG